MQFFILPSLQHMSLVKTTALLWNQENINDLIVSFFTQSLFHFEIQSEWNKIAEEVIKKVFHLYLPEHLKEKVHHLIRPIGIELLKWVQYHETFLSDKNIIQMRLCDIPWTSEGSIDRSRTIKLLIQEENIDIVKRYNLACMYCCEEYIPALWYKIPEEEKKEFNYELRDLFFSQDTLIVYWTFFMKGKLEALEYFTGTNGFGYCIDKFMLGYAVFFGFKEACKYFWKKVTLFTQRNVLVKLTTFAAKRQFELSDMDLDFPNDYIDIVRFLLSQMTEEQLRQTFANCPSQILRIFLEWPLQSLFTEVAKLSIPCMSEHDFQLIFLYIFRYLAISDYRDYDYQELFGDYWKLSPVYLRRYVLQNQMSNCAGFLFGKLLFKNDRRNISLILKDTSAEQREMILHWSKSIFEDTIFKEDWNILKYFILLCVSSKEKLKEFKENCIVYINSVSHERSDAQKNKWNKFLQHIDYLIDNFSLNCQAQAVC